MIMILNAFPKFPNAALFSSAETISSASTALSIHPNPKSPSCSMSSKT